MKVSERIAKAREAKGWSQVELAKRLGVSPGTVGSWETGDHGPKKKRMARVAAVLGLDVLELLT